MDDLLNLTAEGFVPDENILRQRLASIKKEKRKPGIDRLAAAQSVQEVYELLGGTLGHAQWAMENRGSFYNRQFVRLLPQQSDVNVKGTFNIISPIPRNKTFDGEPPIEGEVVKEEPLGLSDEASV